MPRIKNYVLPGHVTRDEASRVVEATPNSASTHCTLIRPPSDADIDLRELLGADIRIPMGTRVIRLSSALGRGIDAWVFASADSIRSHLRSGKSTMTGLSYKRGMLSFSNT